MQILNARYLLCPLPVIRVQDRVKRMQQGEVLEVVCTDPGTVHDIPAWCRINGHRVIDSKNVNDEYTFTLEVGSRP
jgi:tRNA 2-thiouridine synthesizing protein A